MIFAQLVAVLTVISSLATKLIGFPDQIRKIYKTKDVRSISIIFNAMTFASYVLRTIHGFIKNDRTVIVGQGIGVIVSGVLLTVIMYYHYHTK